MRRYIEIRRHSVWASCFYDFFRDQLKIQGADRKLRF